MATKKFIQSLLYTTLMCSGAHAFNPYQIQTPQEDNRTTVDQADAFRPVVHSFKLPQETGKPAEASSKVTEVKLDIAYKPADKDIYAKSGYIKKDGEQQLVDIGSVKVQITPIEESKGKNPESFLVILSGSNPNDTKAMVHVKRDDKSNWTGTLYMKDGGDVKKTDMGKVAVTQKDGVTTADFNVTVKRVGRVAVHTGNETSRLPKFEDVYIELNKKNDDKKKDNAIYDARMMVTLSPTAR